MKPFAGVSSPGNDFFAAHDDCADRNIAGFKRQAGFLERKEHHSFIKFCEQANTSRNWVDWIYCKSIIPQNWGLYKLPV